MRNYYDVDYRGAVVYMIVNLINRKKYVGSCVYFNGRKNHHRCLLRKNTHKGAKLQNAWNKYGESNFEIHIIQYCRRNKRELKRYEQMWMDFYDSYKNGYNMTAKSYSFKGSSNYISRSGVKIGSWNKGRKATPEAIRNQSISHMGKNKGKDSHVSKPVAQYDFNGKLIREYDSARDASRELGYDFKNISDCCRGNREYHKDYIFVFAIKNKISQQKRVDRVIRKINGYVNPKGKTVAQYDFSGRLIKKWNNSTELQKFGFEQGGISQCCLRKIKHYKGYVWMYWDDVKYINKKALLSMINNMMKKAHLVRKIAQCDTNGIPIKIWNCKSDIVNSLRISYDTLSECCKGERGAYLGYVWKYADTAPAPVATVL